MTVKLQKFGVGLRRSPTVTNWPVIGMVLGLGNIYGYMGEGIINADLDSWKTQMKMWMSLMHNSKFARCVEKILWQKLESNLFPMLEHFMKLDAEVNLQDVFQRFTYDNICLLVLGFDPSSLSIGFPEVPSKVAFTRGGGFGI
ncbi:hypothetical protein QQP08_013675 [Theobroma cacao]|nr:hypothetical protein QQP08_013675 [Theobroma cacao]